MKRALAGLLLAALSLAGCGGDVPVPPERPDAAAMQREAEAFLQAMKPRREGKPVVAVLARNAATETTDFLLSHAVLQRSGVAEVKAVAPQRGAVRLYPALQVEVAEDLAGFDRAHPRGADYVIVPAMEYEKGEDPAVTAWLKRQGELGARIVGVCAGALVVGSAGLLDGRRFTTHWYFRKDILERHPGARYAAHQRYVADRNVATTTGISASVPAMLALVEAIGGRERAQALAAELGVDAWGPMHDSAAFGLDPGVMWHYIVTQAAFWRHEDWRIDVQEGMDDVALAFASDAWTRTGRVSVAASASAPVKLRSGLVLIAQPAPPDMPRVPLSPQLKPVAQLDRTLCEIRDRFGAASQRRVTIGLEYPAAASACS